MNAEQVAQLVAQIQKMEQQIEQLSTHNNELRATMHNSSNAAAGSNLVAAAAAAAAVAAPQRSHSSMKIAAASTYSGSAAALETWLREMDLQYGWYNINSDAERVRAASTQLRDAALDWLAGLSVDEKNTYQASYSSFVAALRERFQPANREEAARLALSTLKQGTKQSAQQHIFAFRKILAAIPSMGESDQLFWFLNGLLPALQMQLRMQGVTTLKEAITIAARVDSVLQSVNNSSARPMYHAASSNSSGVAMDLSALLGHANAEEEDQSPDNTGTSPTPAAPIKDDAPITQAQFRQFLSAMQQHRGGSFPNGGKQVRFGSSSRGLPKVQGLSEQQVRDRMEKGACFGCGEPGHRKFQCPSRQQQEN